MGAGSAILFTFRAESLVPLQAEIDVKVPCDCNIRKKDHERIEKYQTL